MKHDDGVKEVNPRDYWKGRLLHLASERNRLLPHKLFPVGGHTRDGIKQKVRRVDTGEVFDSLWAAAKTLGIQSKHLSSKIRCGHRCRGVLFERAE